jgi:DHA1 family tetracycline resistance protein-like MFS transporter
MASIHKQLLPYAIVVLFGFIGLALPLPMLPEMFLDPERSILPKGYSIELKTFLLGLLMASYPLGQLFGSPLFGRISDRYGRKKTILYTLLGTGMGYVVAAVSASYSSSIGIFIGLCICGFFEGNVAIAQSVIADVTKNETEHKAFHFGLINCFISLGFIIGPLIGGQMSDPTIVSWFSFATPFWVAAILALFNVLFIAFFSKETLLAKPLQKEEHLKSFFKTLKMPSLKNLYLANFFLALGFFSYFRFLPVFLERVFNFTSSQLGYAMVFTSVVMAISAVTLNKLAARYLSPIKSTAIFSFLLAVMLIIVVLPDSPWALLATVPPTGIFLAIAITNGNVIISNEASQDMQGLAMGALVAIQVLAEVLTGVAGGALAASLPSLPLFIGSLMAIICCFILMKPQKKIGKG